MNFIDKRIVNDCIDESKLRLSMKLLYLANVNICLCEAYNTPVKDDPYIVENYHALASLEVLHATQVMVKYIRNVKSVNIGITQFTLRRLIQRCEKLTYYNEGRDGGDVGIYINENVLRYIIQFRLSRLQSSIYKKQFDISDEDHKLDYKPDLLYGLMEYFDTNYL